MFKVKYLDDFNQPHYREYKYHTAEQVDAITKQMWARNKWRAVLVTPLHDFPMAG